MRLEDVEEGILWSSLESIIAGRVYIENEVLYPNWLKYIVNIFGIINDVSSNMTMHESTGHFLLGNG